MNDLLHAWQYHCVEVVSHFHQDVLAPPFVFAVEIDDGVAGRAGTGEEVDDFRTLRAASRSSNAIFYQRDGFGEVERIIYKEIFENLGPVVR